MWLSQVALTNFRNYRRLGLELAPGVAIFCGQNGQGKTNLLEAVYVLATTRSPRTSNERQLVTWQTADPALDPLAGLPPFARLEGRVRRDDGEVHLELLLKGEGTDPAAERPPEPTTQGEVTGPVGRTIKVNGLPTRATELIGQLAVVYFAPEDVALAGGPPAGRRKYLDLANSQVAPLYLRAMQQYNRILSQRNHVLRLVRERRQPRAAVDPWTDQLVRTGSFVLRHRLGMLAAVNQRARGIFQDLSGTAQTLRVVYRCTAGEALQGTEPPPDTRALAGELRQRLAAAADREVEQAVSLVGPHRDDFGFVLDGVDLNAYGSRGQQRLAVLALKLAEADWMRAETEEVPVVLLDDVLSELDPHRRQYVLGRVMPRQGEDHRQVWITTTETESFPPSLLEQARRYVIDAGSVRRA